MIKVLRYQDIYVVFVDFENISGLAKEVNPIEKKLLNEVN